MVGTSSWPATLSSAVGSALPGAVALPVVSAAAHSASVWSCSKCKYKFYPVRVVDVGTHIVTAEAKIDASATVVPSVADTQSFTATIAGAGVVARKG